MKKTRAKGTTSEFRTDRTRISCIRYRLRKTRAYYKPATNGQVKSLTESGINDQPYLFALSLIEIPQAGNNLATTKPLSQDKVTKYHGLPYCLPNL